MTLDSLVCSLWYISKFWQFSAPFLETLQVITAMAPLHTSRGNSHIWDLLRDKGVQNDAQSAGNCSNHAPGLITDPTISPKNKTILSARGNSKVEIIWLVVFYCNRGFLVPPNAVAAVWFIEPWCNSLWQTMLWDPELPPAHQQEAPLLFPQRHRFMTAAAFLSFP